MLGSTLVAHALGGGPLRLVFAGGTAPALGLSRSGAGLSLGADGVTWSTAVADVPRFHGPARRLLLEGQRTNSVRSPRFEGAAAPSTNASGQVLTGSKSGVTLAVVGLGTENGLPCLDLRMTGTATAADTFIAVFETGTTVAAAQGQNWAGSLFVRQVSGTAGNVRFALELRPTDSGNTALSGFAAPAVTADGTLARYGVAWTLSPAGTAYLRLNWRIAIANGTTYNEVIRLAVPMLEQGGSVSSPVLPPAGTVAASTRAADAATLALPAAAAAQGTLIGSFLLPQAASSGAEQGLLHLDNGTDAERITVRNLPGGNALEAAVVAGGSATGVLPGGSPATGSVFRLALAWNAGGVALCVNGGAVQATSVVPAALTRLIVGRSLFGEVGPLNLHASRLADASLQSFTAA